MAALRTGPQAVLGVSLSGDALMACAFPVMGILYASVTANRGVYLAGHLLSIGFSSIDRG